MIRMDYINDTYTFESDDILRPYSKYLNSCLDDMEPVFSEYSLVCDKIDLELMMMESVSETTMMIYEDAKKSFLQRVGEKILELRDKFMEFVNKMIDKIKTFSFNHKSNEQKLQKLLKEHPEFKNDTLMAVREGTLNLNNIKSLKDLDDNFNEIIKLAKKDNIDPDSLQGKIEAFKEKYNAKIERIEKAAKTTTVIITASLAVITFVPKIAEALKTADECKKKRNNYYLNAYKELQNGIKDNNGNEYKITNDMGKYQAITSLNRWIDGEYAKILGKNLNVIDLIRNSIDKFLDSHDVTKGKSKDAFHFNMQYGNDIKAKTKK